MIIVLQRSQKTRILHKSWNLQRSLQRSVYKNSYILFLFVKWRATERPIFNLSYLIMISNNLNFNYFFIFPLLAAISVTAREIITAGFPKKTNSLHIVFTSSLIVTIIAGLITIFTYTPINTEYINIILITSLFVTIANIFLY